MKSWIEVPANSDFPIENIPFGVFQPASKELLPRVGVAIGEYVLDLAELKKSGVFNHLKFDTNVFAKSSLNPFIFLGKKITGAVRKEIIKLLSEKNATLRDDKKLRTKILHKMNEVKMLLPVEIGDYTDFYSSEQHAYNVGCMFRDPEKALMPNWKYLPVGYHGRASSIVVSGTNFHRPQGQMKPADMEVPIFGSSKQLDFELEMGFIIGKETTMGKTISTHDAEEYMFGMVLFNDWSARDIQSWEYVPLGPFLGKNFCSSISPWVVTMEALEPFRIAGPKQDPKILPYLEYKGDRHYDINLEVWLTAALDSKSKEEKLISHSNFKNLYWNMVQQLAHHTINGCNVRVGDLMASGTISGTTPDSYGSMLELTWRGTKPIKLSDGSERKFINDNDIVTMRAYCQKENLRIGFGEVSGKVLPAK